MRVLDEPPGRSIDQRPPPDWRKTAKEPSWAVPPGKEASLLMTGGRLGDTSWRAAHLPRNTRAYSSVTQKNEDSFCKRRHCTLTVLGFDRKKLAQDTLSAISQFSAGEKDVGHDGREYAVGEKTRRADTVLPPSRTVMTLQETADYLRVTRSTIQRLLKSNQIPAFRIGRHWRFNTEEIETWCSSRALKKDLKANV
jgi:excisionase family DNA binding protein